MTPQEVASFAFAQEFIGWTAFAIGFIVSGFIKTLINQISHGFSRPTRIKFASLQGRTDKKTDFEYLYLFKGSYYTLEQKDFLIKERMKNIRPTHIPVFFYFSLLFVFLILGFLLSQSTSILGF